MEDFNVSEEEIYKIDWENILKDKYVSCEVFKKYYEVIKSQNVSDDAIICFVMNNKCIEQEFLQYYIFPLLRNKELYNW